MASTITQGLTTISLAYDANHQRVRQQSTVGGVTTTTIYLNDPMSGAMSEWVQVGSATPAFNDYLSLDGQIVAQRSVRNVAPLWGSGITWGAGSANPFAWGAAPGSLWGSAAPANPPRFTWGADPWSGPVVSWAYFVLDNLGSVAVVTDQGANVTARLSNDSWGKQRNANGTDAACNTITAPTTRGFTNQEEVAAACLVNLNARMYDPSIGKFLAPDPVLSNPLSLQGINAYAYVQNNPLSLVDPTGLYSIDGMETVVVTGIRPRGAAPTTGCAGSCFPSGSATIPPWVTLTDYRGSTTIYDAPADYGLGVLQPLGPPGGTAAKGGISQAGSAGNPSGLPPRNSVLSNPMLDKKFSKLSNQTLSGGANTNAARYKDGGTGAGSDASDGTNGAAFDIARTPYGEQRQCMAGCHDTGDDYYSRYSSPDIDTGLAKAVNSVLGPLLAAFGFPEESAVSFSPAETRGLSQLFGQGPQGAQKLLDALAEGSVNLPPGVTPGTLNKYGAVAQSAIDSGIDKIGTQELRLRAIQQLKNGN